MTIDQDRWKAGYDAARRFYGTEARASLRAIVAELEAFRTAFPKLPATVEPHIARIEQLAQYNDGRPLNPLPVTPVP